MAASRGQRPVTREPLQIQRPEGEQMVPEPRNEDLERQQPGLGPRKLAARNTRKRQHRGYVVRSCR